MIPNVNKQFSDVPSNKVMRKKSEQNRPQGANAAQMQAQHFLQVQGIDQMSISKGSFLDQRLSSISKLPPNGNLSVINTLFSDQSNPNQQRQMVNKMMIEEDLNELQSIMSRHHKRTTSKQRRRKTKQGGDISALGGQGGGNGLDAVTDVDVGQQSFYDDS